MALTYSTIGELGSTAPDFSLTGTDGKTYSLKDFHQSKVLVVTFMCNHCPYVIGIQNRLNHLVREYSAKGVQWVGINSNDSSKYPDDNFEAMKVRAREQGYAFPYLWDETQAVARAYGAVCTPEFHVFHRESEKFILKYKGRMDDNWKDEKAVSRRDLAEALDDLLAHRDPRSEQVPAMGCSIKWKSAV
jgi:peroxiredoxin